MGTCPKCGFNRRPEDRECPQCGVVYKKYEAIEKKKAAEIRAKRTLEEAARQSEKLRRQSAENKQKERRENLYKLASDFQERGETSPALEKYYEITDLYPNTVESLNAKKQIKIIKEREHMATETSQAEQAPKEQQSFAITSLVFCILGGIVSIGAGIYLASLKSAGSNSMFEAIANGIGWYCIGKGLFMIASPFQLRGAAYHLFRRG